MQKKIFFGVNFIILRKKCVFFGRFYAFYGQRSVTAAWATRSPWSISFLQTYGNLIPWKIQSRIDLGILKGKNLEKQHIGPYIICIFFEVIPPPLDYS